MDSEASPGLECLLHPELARPGGGTRHWLTFEPLSVESQEEFVRIFGRSAFVAAMAATTLLIAASSGQAAMLGEELANLSLKDADGQPATIPDFGKKVLTIVYADSQTADLNDPVADALKASGVDVAKVRGIGLANLKDTWVPNYIARMIIRRKVEKYESTILLDEEGTVPAKWDLGDCDDESVIIVIGADKRVKYIKKGAVRGEEIDEVVAIVRAEAEKPAPQ